MQQVQRQPVQKRQHQALVLLVQQQEA